VVVAVRRSVREPTDGPSSARRAPRYTGGCPPSPAGPLLRGRIGASDRCRPPVGGWRAADTLATTVSSRAPERSARGEFDLEWLRETDSEWGVRAVPSKSGLAIRHRRRFLRGDPGARSGAHRGPRDSRSMSGA